LRILQARGRPVEAEQEVRALLDLLLKNTAAVKRTAAAFEAVLKVATLNLNPLPLYPSTLNTQHPTPNTQHSTLNTQHSTLNPQPSTLNSQLSTLNP
jgi:hypothetical protein